MGDIDFDELDKAVNSLMSDPAAKAESATSNTGEDRPVQTISLSDKRNPTSQQIEEVASKIGGDVSPSEHIKTVTLSDSAAPPPKPSAVKPASKGRVMDIHPPARSPKVQSSSDKEEAPKSEETEEESKTPELSPIVEPEVEVKADEAPVSVEAPDTGPYSPFLPDAKVEKRPLGGAPSSDEKKSDEDEKNDEGTSEASADDAFAPQGDIDSLLEKEEEEQLANTSKMGEMKSGDGRKDSEEDNQRTLDATDVHGDENSEESQLAKLESNELGELSAASSEVQSIESADTESMKNGTGIYDVDAHHQSLKHPPKQKSGIPTVIAIIVIILLCAGLGAAAYFLTGQGL